jgi:beta-lactam-binding protein with PASTA domain
VDPDAIGKSIDAVSADMAQWCAPWRRQQAGTLDSACAGRIASSGPSENSRINSVEKMRLIFNSGQAETPVHACNRGSSGVVPSLHGYYQEQAGMSLSSSNMSAWRLKFKTFQERAPLQFCGRHLAWVTSLAPWRALGAVCQP